MATPAAYVRTEARPIGDLSPYPGNARRGDVAVILESLCRNSQYRSLIVRETEPGALVVLAGNHTLQGLAAHGPGPCGLVTKVNGEEQPCALCRGEEWTPEARCEIVHCDDDTARRINLVDNRSAELGTWDNEALAELLGQADDDLTGTGYSSGDLDDLLTALDEANDDGPDDEEPEPEQPAQTPPTTTPAAADLVPPPPPGHAHLTLTYPAADHDEADRLIATARTAVPDTDAPTVVLSALRLLDDVLARRDQPAHDVPVTTLLAAAGITHE
ncbi:hypothetical protein [Streptomyces microflavus]|uniref:hypothetical protein n=1 Tax=Streptomyces microflavus TaxID=1919 RepID=UPI0038177278